MIEAVSWLLGTAGKAASSSWSGTTAVAGAVVETSFRISTAPVRALIEHAPAPDVLRPVLTVVDEFLGGRPSRRCWQGESDYWIELRGLHTDGGAELAAAVLDAVGAEAGVRTARVNYPLSRVVVAVDADGPTVGAVCQLVDRVERDMRGADEEALSEPTDLPADGVVLAGRAVAATAHGVGLAVALAGRAMLWPSLPSGLTAVVTLVDYQPRLRAALESRLGATAADTAISLAAAGLYTLTQAPSTLAVELLRHLAQIGESTSAARAWEEREQALSPHADSPDAVAVPPRPRPMPPGPVERHAERSGVAQGLAASSIGVLTGNVNAAATAAVVTAPKAARNAREAFASTLSRGLAQRYSVLPLRPAALRRLDRIDAVVIDPRALFTDELQIGRIRDVAERDRAAAWEWAQTQLDAGALSAGWHAVPAAGEVFARPAHHPLAENLLKEIRRAGAEAVSIDLDELDDLRSSFDQLAEFAGSVDDALAAAVSTLQDAGNTVAVIASQAPQAIAAADLGIGLPSPEGRPPWHADLLADDLVGVWRVLHALPAARATSRRGVHLASGATLLGSLLMIPGVRGTGPGPVTAGAALGLSTGFLAARGVLADPDPVPMPVQHWHAMSVEQVREALPPPQPAPPPRSSRLVGTAKSSAGLVDHVTAPTRRAVGELATALRHELSDPLTPILAVGSAASAVLGSPVDAVLVGSVLTGNAVLASVQQVRAERLLRRLLAVQDPPARRVLPDGGYDSVAAGDLRPGEVIEVRPGEVIPADARIIETADLEVDESALTGESLPVPKQIKATPATPLAERSCMLHAATTVVAGSATAVVTAVGARTETRRAVETPHTAGSAVGLQSQLRELTNKALPFSLAGGAVVSGLGLLRGYPLRGAVSSGVAVAVAAVPEGLPLVATLAQQASARRLTKAAALVRSPRSVEALGRVDVVCFDKTGTLSENKLRVSRVQPADGLSKRQVLECAAVATPAANGERHEHATDAAVIAAADLNDIAGPTDRDRIHLPFRSGRPYSASIVDKVLSVKGAPEVVMDACAGVDDAARDQVREMARSGLRVLAVAQRKVTAAQSKKARENPDVFDDLCGRGLELVGLLGLSDTPREESAGLLKTLREQNIGVRLITGDHPVTATAIAAELGLPVGPGQVLTGSEWEALARRDQETAVRQRLVFARMSPEHKVQIVQTLERTGLVCAMVGDGANDAAAIRAATVGIGVASHGSDPARTAADLMLLDGRIGALTDALDEGRQLWQRVQAAVAVLLGGNAGEVAFAIAGTALSGRSPLNARQLLLVNMMTDALPAAALAVSPTNRSTEGAQRGPDRAALWRTVAIRGATTATAASAAWLMSGFTMAPRRASTVALVALVSTQLGQTLIDSHSPLVVATAAGSLVTLGALISTPGVSQLLGCTPIGPVGWSQALGTAGVATAAAAVAPRVLSRFQSSMSTTPTRQSSAYSSRNGTDNTRDTTSVNGSVADEVPVDDTPSTLDTLGVETSTSP